MAEVSEKEPLKDDAVVSTEDNTKYLPDETRCLSEDKHSGLTATGAIARKRSSNNKKPTTSWERALKLLIPLLTVAVLVELVWLLAVTVQWRDARTDALARREQRVCVHNASLDRHGHEHACGDKLEVVGDQCCGDASVVVDILIKQYSTDKFSDTSAARMLTDRCDDEDDGRPSTVAMLAGLSMREIRQHTQLGNREGVVFWNQNTPRTILSGSTYNKGAIFVDHPGHYYIYSQIKVTKTHDMVPASLPGQSSTQPFFSHSLYRHPKQKQPEILLESSNSACNISSSDNEMSSSFGGVFELSAGDKLYVETTHPLDLVEDIESNFFGLYSV